MAIKRSASPCACSSTHLWFSRYYPSKLMNLGLFLGLDREPSLFLEHFISYVKLTSAPCFSFGRLICILCSLLDSHQHNTCLFIFTSNIVAVQEE